MGDTFDFYWQAYGRDSIDDAGMPLIGTVHYGEDYDNAFWNGEQMVYGDGDGEQFNRFTISIDVIGHELTHGVTEQEAGLVYWSQSGALNESVSDVFGSLVKQAVNQETANDADWLIGEGLFTDQVQGVALRSMAEPGTAYDDPHLGKDPQPAHMKDYVRTLSDSGGVHINSGIPNHAFYLAAVEIGGYAWETAGQIWYETLLSPSLTPSAQFSDFARITVQTAQLLYGSSSREVDAVSGAWSDVGVQVGGTATRAVGSQRLVAGSERTVGSRAIGGALAGTFSRGYSTLGDFFSPQRPRGTRRTQRESQADGDRRERTLRNRDQELGPDEYPTDEAKGPDEYPTDEAKGPDEYPTDETKGPDEYPTDETKGPDEYPTDETKGPDEYPTEDTVFKIFDQMRNEGRLTTVPALGELNRLLAERGKSALSQQRAQQLLRKWRSNDSR
jgi:Thermolysin metallopeptidase, alpha-helical domain/Thermolysin metallopeptidase, catalytic domain